MSDLATLLEEARHASPNTRITLRDSIAEHGEEAIEAVTPWLVDRDLSWFATRVIWKAGEHGARERAIAVLVEASGDPTVAASYEDLDFHLRKLGHQPRPTVKPRDPFAVAPIPAKAGTGWPGFQPHEFGNVTGTRWRSREGEQSLVPLILRPLRHLHQRFDSWAIYHSPEVHFAVKDRYMLAGDWHQGWRACKLVVYAHGYTPEDPDAAPVVTAGYYIEKGGAPAEPWVPDDRWDWPYFVDSLRDERVQRELAALLARYDLRMGDYVGGNRFGPGKATVGFVGSLEEGQLVLRSAGTEIGRSWDALADALADLPRDSWHDFHVWRSWPAALAMEGGPSFAGDALVPVLSGLAGVYLAVLKGAHAIK